MKPFSQKIFAGISLSICCFSLSCSKNNSSPVTTKPQTITVSSIAGTSPFGIGLIDGPGNTASFLYAYGIAIDASGNLFVSDGDKVIRKITPSNVVSTYAGSANSTGDTDGNLSTATFSNARGLTFDPSGNLIIADGTRIKKITKDGTVSTIWMLNTVNVDITSVVTDPAGNIYSKDFGNGLIRKTTPTGVTTVVAGGGLSPIPDGTGIAASFYCPIGITIDAAGNLFVVQNVNESVRKITPAGVVTTIAGNFRMGSSNGVGGQASFANPTSIAADASGNLYVTDGANHLIRKVTQDGTVSTLAGNGMSANTDGPAATASFSFLGCLTVDPTGNIYIAAGYKIRKITFQ